MNKNEKKRRVKVCICAEIPMDCVGSVIVEASDNLSDDDIKEALSENDGLLSDVCDDFAVDDIPEGRYADAATVNDLLPTDDQDGPAVLRIERDEDGNLVVEDLYDEVQ